MMTFKENSSTSPLSTCCLMSDKIGFLNDSRRLNVALTRGRDGLIVIRSKKTMDKLTRQYYSVQRVGLALKEYRIHVDTKLVAQGHEMWPRCLFYTPEELRMGATTFTASGSGTIFDSEPEASGKSNEKRMVTTSVD